MMFPVFNGWVNGLSTWLCRKKLVFTRPIQHGVGMDGFLLCKTARGGHQLFRSTFRGRVSGACVKVECWGVPTRNHGTTRWEPSLFRGRV